MRLLLQAVRPLLSLVFVGLLAVFPLYGQTQATEEVLAKAKAAQSSGEYVAAADLYAHATAMSPGTAELWSNRGVMEFLSGRSDAAIGSLKHALRLRPGLFVPVLFLGKAYLQIGKPALALPYLDHAHSLRANDPEVLLALGAVHSDLNDPRQAESFYSQAARVSPDRTSAWFGLGGAALAAIVSDGRSLAELREQSVWARALYADELLAQGRPLEATDTYTAILAKASHQEKAILMRNVEWMQSHPELYPLPASSQQALQTLNAKLASNPVQMELPPFCSSPTSDPTAADSKASNLEKVACAFWAGDYEATLAQAGLVLRQTPQSAEALYWSIKANERLAVASLARFEELAPHSAASYVMVGDLYREQQNMDSALAEYRQALSLDAHNPPALMGAVMADLSGGKLDEAESMGKIALADRPLDPQLNLLMAEVLAARNQYDQIAPYLEKCAGAPPELQFRVHSLLGRADAEAGKPQEAIRQFEMALPGDEDGSIHYQLSRLYRKTGDIAHAQKAEAEAKALLGQRRVNAAIVVREATGANP